ncbi:MAG: radical SAM protein, partial [Bacteroidota bacterium]
MSILLITPPFTQLNTPYPATAYLQGFLNTKGIPAEQMDLGIEVILELFTQRRLAEVFARSTSSVEPRSQVQGDGWSSNARRILALQREYLATIEPVIRFLQGKQPTLARQIASENFLPQASRFDNLAELDLAFGNMGHQDKAKHLATLYLEDLSDFIVETLDPHFGFSRYAERLGRSANSFDELHAALQQPLSYIDELTVELLQSHITYPQSHTAYPLACFSVPFPGNLFSAFRCAQWLKANRPEIKTVMGGGFPNTELRSVSDPRVFDYFDYITLDDGELPLELLWQHTTASPRQASETTTLPPEKPLFKRTFHLEDGQVLYNDFSLQRDYRMSEIGTPDYTGLPLDRYISVIEIANPMHSLWSDGRWNKLTMAHGCYWGKCTFCDVSLDYIGNYKPVNASLLVDRMEEMMAQTGENGFHFVDEAAPPALMRDLALEIIRRELRVSWWTNIRF